MTPAPFSDGVTRLALAAEDERARTLLKAATELYVLAPRHSRAEVALYEELALQLMGSTPRDDRIAVARQLAPHRDAPEAVLRRLLEDEAEVAAPVIAGAPELPEVHLLALVATGTPAHLAALARRPNLSPALVEALVRRLDPDDLTPLLANPRTALPAELRADLLALARGRPALAQALAARADLEDTDLVDLFLDLDERGRRRVLQALEILALREFAARKPLPVTPKPDPDAIADLARAALSRDVGRIGGQLARLARIDEATARRLLVDAGGEPLALALKAAGLDLPTATRVILFSGGETVRDYFAVKRLVALFQSVSLRSASLLADRWCESAGPLPGRAPRHRPQAEDGRPVRSREPAATPLAPAAEPLRRERG